MPLTPRSRVMPYRFEGLPSLTQRQVMLWNWYSRVGPARTEWTSWVADIFGHLLERPSGLRLQLVQTHLVETQTGEKTLSFGSKQEIFIGRGTDNDVVLPASAISNRHTRIILKDARLYLEDLGTALGTYLGDKKVQPNQVHLLTDGDQFTVFPFRFRVALERSWSPETNVVIGECRMQPVNRSEFLQSSPATWRFFELNAHPGGKRALLELDPAFLGKLQEVVLAPLGLDRVKGAVPSDDAILGFMMLAFLEHLNRNLKFPTQFSFVRGSRKNLDDLTPGMRLTFAVNVAGLTGNVRIFVPLDFVTEWQSDRPSEPGEDYPPGIGWCFPVSAGFVDLTPDEISQVGLGDILVAQHAPATLFPNDFSKGWTMTRDGSNSRRFLIDKYLERSTSVEAGSESQTAVTKPDIRSLPLRLQVILAEKEFSLAEIQSLAPGTIVELEAGKSDPVRLMVNGKILGEGELVDVEGNLAVKVLRWRST